VAKHLHKVASSLSLKNNQLKSSLRKKSSEVRKLKTPGKKLLRDSASQTPGPFLKLRADQDFCAQKLSALKLSLAQDAFQIEEFSSTLIAC
jgi:hypothetical protein